MKLYNKSGNGLQHVLAKEGKMLTYTLPNGATADIPEEIAEKWLKINGVEEYIAPADLEKAAAEAKAKADAEKAALQEENAKLLAEIEKLKAAAEAKAKADAEKANKAKKQK